MTRSLHRLTDRSVRALGAGVHCDGGGLYLQVTEGKADGVLRRSWLFRFATGETAVSRNGKPRQVERQMGLGSYPDVTLGEERQKAADARKLRLQGIDPIAQRNVQRAAQPAARAKNIKFEQAAEQYIAAHEAGWGNARRHRQWISTIKTYANPIIGKLDVRDIDTGLVMQVLEPVWTTKPVTTGRVRGRIESILDRAKTRGYRDGENPARWRGHLKNLLPAKSRIHKKAHHKALAYNELAAFMQKLRARDSVAARALEFTVLNANRTGDIIGNDREERPPMKWSHVDFDGRVWTIPATKNESEHRIPLSDAAVGILKKMKALGLAGDIVFQAQPGRDRSLSKGAMAAVLIRMRAFDATVHGFRSTFRTWAAERTSFPREVVETALAHTVGDETERAYQRGDLFEKRRRLMTAWADYCASKVPGTDNKVRPLRAGMG